MQERPWHRSYPPGMPRETPVEPGLTVPALIERSCDRYADRIAYTCFDAVLSYRELEQYSRALAAWLQQAGLERGERLALMLPNSIVHPIAMAGALRAGLIVVSVNPLYTARELEHQLRDSGSSAIVTTEAVLPMLRQIKETVALRQVVCAAPGELLPAGRRWQPDPVFAARDGSIAFATALATDPGRHVPVKPDPSDIAYLQYTGGTTGVSKGAALTHANMLACVVAELAWLGQAFRDDGTQCVTPLPLYHIYPLNVALMLIACGGTNRLVPNPRDPAEILKEFKRAPFHVFTGINTLLNGLLASGGLDAADFAETRLVIGAGSTVQESVAQRWKAATGVPIREGYGLTECSPGVTYNVLGARDWTGSIGVPVPSTDVKLIDDAGREVAQGTAGELCVRGPQVFSGYWQRPQESANAFTADGWFRTGDVATMDENGLLYIVDRLKDMILVSGFNVYPNEIEGVVAAMPEVLECACIGVPDARSGEVPQLFVVPRDAALTAAQVEAHCRANLTAYKIPRRIVFIDALPKSPVGKILRRELRDAPALTS